MRTIRVFVQLSIFEFHVEMRLQTDPEMLGLTSYDFDVIDQLLRVSSNRTPFLFFGWLVMCSGVKQSALRF